MVLNRDYSLKRHNTFGLDVAASTFAQVRTLKELRDALDQSRASSPRTLILGGGSNILFVRDFEGLVIQIDLRGIRLLRESEDCVQLEAAAGEGWQDLVLHCVERGWGGIENLSLIPGTVGGAPVQNVGAYGAELQDVLIRVEGIRADTGERTTMERDQCGFGYRKSVFKEELRGNLVITSVVLELRKRPVVNTRYEALASELANLGRQGVTIRDVADAVCRIRQRKLPDPRCIGSAGSFFKNPEVSPEAYQNLKQRFPYLPAYPMPSGGFRIAGGWLIEQCGWKGRRVGKVGMFENHALVLVNYGGATGEEILSLAEDVQTSVQDRFGIRLEPEVHIV